MTATPHFSPSIRLFLSLFPLAGSISEGEEKSPPPCEGDSSESARKVPFDQRDSLIKWNSSVVQAPFFSINCFSTSSKLGLSDCARPDSLFLLSMPLWQAWWSLRPEHPPLRGIISGRKPNRSHPGPFYHVFQAPPSTSSMIERSTVRISPVLRTFEKMLEGRIERSSRRSVFAVNIDISVTRRQYSFFFFWWITPTTTRPVNCYK